MQSVTDAAVTAAQSGNMKIFPDAVLTAVLGYGVVFVGLALLMAVIVIMGKIMTAKKAPAKQTGPAGNTPGNVKDAKVQKLDGPFAPGSAGELKLHGVPERDAAMVMAIVADKLGKPVNELRFKSIKEVK